MITIDDILKIDNTNLNTVSIPIWIKDNVPGYESSGGHEHLEYITYPVPGTSIGYGELTELTKKDSVDITPIDEMFLMCRYFGYSDYDNSCMVERSNHKLFMEKYGGLPWVFPAYGGYGTTDLCIALKGLLDPENEETAQEIIDLINDLNKYPCIDDGDMSNMEYDAFLEALDQFEMTDCMKMLSKKFGITVHDFNQDAFKDILLENDGKHNPSYIIESGGGCYIDTEQLIEGLTLEDIKPALMNYEVI